VVRNKTVLERIQPRKDPKTLKAKPSSLQNKVKFILYRSLFMLKIEISPIKMLKISFVRMQGWILFKKPTLGSV
jgi:hypothetical protein